LGNIAHRWGVGWLHFGTLGFWWGSEVGRCAILYIWYGRVAQGGEGFFVVWLAKWWGGMGVRRALGSTNWGNGEIFSAKVGGRLRKFATFDSATLN